MSPFSTLGIRRLPDCALCPGVAEKVRSATPEQLASFTVKRV